MSHKSQTEAGFTIVELLATLFIALMFLATGYMLYYTLITRGAHARQQVAASDVASSTLTSLSRQASTSCQAKSLSTPSFPSNSGVPEPRSMSAQITCPKGTSSSINRLTVTVNFTINDEQRKVVHARDIDATP